MLVGILAPRLALRGPLPCAAGSSRLGFDDVIVILGVSLLCFANVGLLLVDHTLTGAFISSITGGFWGFVHNSMSESAFTRYTVRGRGAKHFFPSGGGHQSFFTTGRKERFA